MSAIQQFCCSEKSACCEGDVLSICCCWYQDDEYLYLVMEYLPGGDMMVR
jgi:hypothetical protein